MDINQARTEFNGFTVEHTLDRTIIYPYGPNYKTHCVYLEPDGSYIAHTKNGNKLGKVDKPRGSYTLEELKEFCKLV